MRCATHFPLAADEAPADHTYLKLRDGSLFCVAGNEHTKDDVLGCLWYARTASGALVKVGPDIKRDPRSHRGLLARAGVRGWPGTSLQAVRRANVTLAENPVRRLREITESTQPRSGAAAAGLERLMAAFRHSSEDPSTLGITGSAAFRAAHQMETDLDFLLYGGLTLARFASAVSGGEFEAFSALDPADERRSAYVRERPGLFRRPELAERRSDVGWCGPVKVDLTEVGPPREPVAALIFDRPRSATGEITGVVESVARGYPVRCRLEGGAPVVVVTRRGWQGILQPGDQIRTSGVLYSSPSGDEFVVDEFGRDPVIADQ
jgi:hypothetical protein